MQKSSLAFNSISDWSSIEEIIKGPNIEIIKRYLQSQVFRVFTIQYNNLLMVCSDKPEELYYSLTG